MRIEGRGWKVRGWLQKKGRMREGEGIDGEEGKGYKNWGGGGK